MRTIFIPPVVSVGGRIELIGGGVDGVVPHLFLDPRGGPSKKVIVYTMWKKRSRLSAPP